MGFFGKLFNDKETGPTTLPLDHSLHKEDYKVIGVGYHAGSIAKLRKANPNWRLGRKGIEAAGLIGEHIYHYSYTDRPVKLERDPTGVYGPNRIMVYIAGEHVGYLPEEHDIHVLEVLRYGSIKYISAVVTGGEWKVFPREGDVLKFDSPVEIKIRIAYSV